MWFNLQTFRVKNHSQYSVLHSTWVLLSVRSVSSHSEWGNHSALLFTQKNGWPQRRSQIVLHNPTLRGGLTLHTGQKTENTWQVFYGGESAEIFSFFINNQSTFGKKKKKGQECVVYSSSDFSHYRYCAVTLHYLQWNTLSPQKHDFFFVR